MMAAALAHAGGSDEITYAVSAVILAVAAWLVIDALRRRRAERSGRDPGGP